MSRPIALALVIAAQAHRGYRLDHTQLLLYVAAGFASVGLGGLLEEAATRRPRGLASLVPLVVPIGGQFVVVVEWS